MPGPSDTLWQDMTDSALLERASAGDRGALEALLLRHAGAAYAAVLARAGSRAETEDLVQETMRRAVAGIGTLREPDRMGAWIYGIALRVSSEWIRRRPGRGASLEGLEPEAPAAQGEGRMERLRAALGRLGEADREALTLHHMEGMGYAAMAGVLGLSEAGVSQRLSRARARLRELLKEDEA